MDLKLLIEFMAICDKLQVESNPNLTPEEKTLYKEFKDEIKKQVK